MSNTDVDIFSWSELAIHFLKVQSHKIFDLMDPNRSIGPFVSGISPRGGSILGQEPTHSSFRSEFSSVKFKEESNRELFQPL